MGTRLASRRLVAKGRSRAVEIGYKLSSEEFGPVDLVRFVTCPTIRIHPAIIAQPSATSAALLKGRFFLGVGTGENLKEHVAGSGWPSADIRLEMPRGRRQDRTRRERKAG